MITAPQAVVLPLHHGHPTRDFLLVLQKLFQKQREYSEEMHICQRSGTKKRLLFFEAFFVENATVFTFDPCVQRREGLQEALQRQLYLIDLN